MYTKKKKKKISPGCYSFFFLQFLLKIGKGINCINFSISLVSTQGKDSRTTKLPARNFDADEEQQGP